MGKFYLRFGKLFKSYRLILKYMSRIAKKPIAIPEKTDVKYSAGVLTVKGPLGEISKTFRPEIAIKVENNEIILRFSYSKYACRSSQGF